MNKYGFVILHYLTYKDTIECINSIIKNVDDKNDYSIVVVDNFSNNGSIEKVKKFFKKNENIYFIENKVNLGFAKGNNVGYEFCKEKLKCNVILILNNDIILKSKNILKQINIDIENYNSAVIGPDIESLVDGGHQNPMKNEYLSKKIIKKNIIKYKFLRLINFFGLYNVLKKGSRRKGQTKIESKYKSEYLLNCTLHGSFLIFTNKFINNMKYAFYPDTFLYNEELILKKICEEKKYKTLYDPNIKVLHKEDSSTNVLTQNSNRKKREFVFKNLIDSYKILIKFY